MRLVIAAQEGLITGLERLTPGDVITVTTTLQVYSVAQDQIDVSTGSNPSYLPGELQLETVALEGKAERS